MAETVLDDDSDGVPEELVRTDLYLEVLIGALLGLEASDANFSLTVMTPGGAISGSAISWGSWHHLTGELLRQANPISEGVITGLDGLIDLAVADDKDRRQREMPSVPPRFVHLKNARLRTPQGLVDVGLWRIPIDKIGGWSLGVPS